MKEKMLYVLTWSNDLIKNYKQNLKYTVYKGTESCVLV